MRLDLDGWRWDVYLRGLMELRRCVGGSDKHGGMFAPKWSWYAIIVTWIKLRCDINASEMLLEWRWDANTGTLMEVRVDMNGCEIYISWPGCSWYKNGLSWDTLWDLDILRCEWDWAEMQFFWSRGIWYVKWLDVRRVHRDLVWIWDATWIEVKNVWTCMEVMQYMDGAETWILGSWCRSGRSVMGVKRIFLYLDVSQMGPGWSWGDAV